MAIDASIPLSGILPKLITPAEVFSLKQLSEESEQRKEERPYRLAHLETQRKTEALTLEQLSRKIKTCLLYTSDAADE